ncbi:hypothetical protein SLS64_009495 [Diaporthe eres]|uniref:Heterokaryon incompatibility domain-containing protein n=1 Tax=Diaporthe eres TaxID=83184 RepID=A0ABR1P0S7_DIAER
MTDYHYDPLPDDDGCIRTVAIHPGESHEDVVVSLTCARFDPDLPPLYEALSYVWGSNENPQYIQVANKSSDASPESCPGSSYHGTARLPVTQNLAVALRHMRLVDEPRVMWIDAICINQQDNAEKGLQVAKMGDVYSKASRVVVWLGPAQNDSHVAMEVMRYLGSQIEVNWDDDAMVSAPGASDLTVSKRGVVLPVKGELWRPIFDLLSRPWFDRLWVRQEIYLATSAVVLCGDKEVPWSFFRGALYCISFKPRTGPVPDDDRLPVLLADRLRLLMGLHSQDTVNLYRLRDRFDETLCQDPRDRIFAVRSLVSPAARAFWPLPDYNRPAADIYKEVLSAYLSRFLDSLDILTQCEFHEGSSVSGTTLATNRRPSWVPDWSVKASSGRKWQGGGCRIGKWHEMAGPGVLRVLGRRKDVVQTVDVIPNWTECRGVPIAEAIQVYRRILPTTIQPDEAYPHGGSLVQAYAHSLVNGSIAERRSNKSGGWPLSKTISGLVEKLIMGHTFSPGELEPGTPSSFVSGLNALANFTDKRLFKGSEGYIGMASPPVRAGDEVWAIVGCSVPMLLRRVDKDKFLVVSECYAEGLADGEGLLGPLPQGIRGTWAPNERGQWMRGFQDVRTGETFFRDPRMESLGLFKNTSEEYIRNPANSFVYEAEELMQFIPGLERIDLV